MEKLKETPIVTYVTRVALSLSVDEDELEFLRGAAEVSVAEVRQLSEKIKERAEKVAALAEFLESKGFMLQVNKQTVYAYSNDVEAQEIKRYMLEAGFKDRDFQILLEYTRGWGML